MGLLANEEEITSGTGSTEKTTVVRPPIHMGGPSLVEH